MIQHIKLSELCSMKSGGTPSRSKLEYYEGDFPWAKISDLEKSDDGYIYKTEEHITQEALESINNRQFKPGTLLLAMYGSVGKTAITKINLTTNQAILGINILDENSLDIKYLKYWFSTIKEKLLNRAVGAALPNISLGIVKDLQIPLPPLPTQQKIASILDAADALRQKDKALLAKYDELTQSLFLDMFGDPVSNPKGWEKVKFLKLFYVETGKLDSNHSDINGKYPFFTCAKEVLAINSYSYDKEALLLAGNNAAGIYDVKHYYGKFDAYQRTYILSLDTNLRNYLFYKLHLEMKLNDLQKLSIGSSTKYLTMKIFERILFIDPPLNLQTQFAERVTIIEQQKAIAQASLEKSEELFNSLLQKAFKGELV